MSGRPWRTDGVDWEDYDLLSGPSGVSVALSLTGPAPGASVIAEHLIKLCEGDLDRLRVGVPHPGEPRSTNLGRINTGLAHGVCGVVAGLAHQLRLRHRTETMTALRTAAGWLIEHRARDGAGSVCWRPFEQPGASLPCPDQPQAWCYGTPGIAWTLWDAGSLLEDQSICDVAMDAMDCLARRWDNERYLNRREQGSHLAICHGAAGVLLVADAFARRAELDSASKLANQLSSFLLERLDEVSDLAVADASLLSGAAGVLAALSAAHGGARGWLPLVGLR